MAKVYLETSFFSACVTTREDVQSLFWRQESLGWLQSESQKHDLFISAEVLAELSHPAYGGSRAALALTVGAEVLDASPEVMGFARTRIAEKVMPGPLEGDAVHVAVAGVHRLEYLLTWNVKHLANPRKRTHLTGICLRAGFVPPQIVTPTNLWEPDDVDD
ncbi:MAG: hypothetical protein IT449_01260 [Phycisphaerales bacterium]|nr:hypothetical protein [Phycisphaerales bacterium]